MKTEKQEAIEHAKNLFDIGSFREANKILEPWNLTWQKMKWHFLDESERPIQRQTQSLIVVRHDGWPIPVDQKTFKLHQTQTDASEHGKQLYGYGQFRILPFTKFIKTTQGKYLKRKFAILQMLKEFQK